MAKQYCPFCKSTKPMRKAGFQLRVGGKPAKQRYECKNCRRITTNPKLRKPRTKKEKS